jgi:putative inorganic carbon (hco3(-)) transporter
MTFISLMKTLAITGWLVASVSVVSVITGGYEFGSRLKVFGENENALGISLLISLIGVIWLALNSKLRYNKTYKTLSYIYLIFIIVIIAFSGSRGSAISLVVTLFVLLMWKSTRRWGGVGLFLIVLGLFIMPHIFTTTIERFLVTRGDTVLGGREAIWLATWQLIQRQPWTGVGIGNAPLIVTPLVRLMRSIGGESTSIHNPVLAIWAETGLPGLLLYLGILGSAVWTFAKTYIYYKSQKSLILLSYLLLVGSIFIGYILSWIKGGGTESEHTYYLMLSLLLVPSHIRKISDDKKPPVFT